MLTEEDSRRLTVVDDPVLQPGREWWRPTAFERNNGHTATYAVSEVMVRPQWRKQGISERLHEALLKKRSEDFAVLLVDVTHPKAQDLYETCGYEKAGEQHPVAYAPVRGQGEEVLP